MVPVIKGGRWVASLAAHHGAPRQWAPGEQTMLMEAASQTWSAAERALAGALLRVNERRLRQQRNAFQAAINGEPLGACLSILAQIAVENFIAGA